MKDVFGQRAAAAALIAFGLAFSGGASAAGVSGAQPSDNFITLSGHVLPALARAAPVVVAEQAKPAIEAPLSLTVVLRRTDEAGFQAYLHDVYDPASPIFRKFLTPTEITEKFGPSQDDMEAVRSYLEGAGLTVADPPANRLTLTVTGARSTVEKAFALRVLDYRLGEKMFQANDRDPSLPAEVAKRVGAITGFSNLATPRTELVALIKAFCNVTGFFAGVGGVAMLQFDKYYLKEEAKCLASAYKALGGGVLTLPDPPPPAWQGVDGTGQKVGIVAFDTFQMSDVSDYLAFIGLPSTKIADITQVHVSGGASPGPDQSEVLLDIADVVSIARGAKIAVYDAPFGGAGSFQAVFNAMISDGVTVISNSWAYCEDQTTLADVQSIDSILQTAAASGISVVTGSGDHGSTCLDGNPNTAHVPASSPHITAVGGTSMKVGPGYTYESETWWDGSASSPPGGQGGFGVSQFFPKPSYQNGVAASTMRSIPDVATDADPQNGVVICQASAGGCPSGLFFGGTSSATPVWAAYVALLNQAQGSNIGFLNPLIYPFAGTDAFHTAASMGTDFAHVGLGSPNLPRLHQRLTAQSTGSASPSVSDVRAFSETNFSIPDAVGTPLPVPADGVTKAYIVIRLADANGNVVPGKTITLVKNGGSAVITALNAVTKVDNGAAIFAVTDLSAETVTFTATDATDAITLQQTPQVIFGVPPAASASINASPSNVPPDGTSTTTITVTLQDALSRPTPGKLIQLSQGGGHSIVTGPNPAVTDAAGQIQFTATNGVSEIVIYTAVDASDGDLPIPGSATVDFTGAATSCVGGAPVPAAGYAITPWANGFFAQNFFFGNVNWGGCPGASNPTFTPSGGAFVADFRTGDLFKFGLEGGTAAGNTLSNLDQTLGQPTFGKDGRLYATHGATTGNFTTGDLIEIDPSTGAQLRVVVANLTCAGALVVDPLSGDLFFDDACTGAGSDNPSIWRVHDPLGGSPTLSVYATLPTTPNGGLAFSPDGTLYAVTGYFNNPNAPIVQISGTDKPQPPTQTTLAGITTDYGIAIAQALPSGAVKSFMVHQGGALQLVDVTTQPFTTTTLATGNIAPAVIGPDGCLYAGASDTIYKLAPTSGGCGFLPTNPAPALVLAPATVAPNPAQGSSQTFTATFKNVSVPAGTPVFFIVKGVNAQVRLAPTDAGGVATLTYTGARAGMDTVTAGGDAASATLISNAAKVTWGPGQHLTFIDLSTSPSGGTAGQAVTVSASLSDASLDPLAVIAGASIHFTLGAQSCNGVTNASGVASCSMTPATPAQLVLSASYAGSAAYTSAAASQGFGVLAAGGSASPPGPPVIGAVTPGDERLEVTFTPPSNDGGSPITSYTVACTPTGGGTAVTATGSQSPITVLGLVNGVTYTCTVSATNSAGPGASSAASNQATPFAGPAAVQLPIPTLTGWGELVLIALLALLAGAALHGRQRPRGHRSNKG